MVAFFSVPRAILVLKTIEIVLFECIRAIQFIAAMDKFASDEANSIIIALVTDQEMKGLMAYHTCSLCSLCK